MQYHKVTVPVSIKIGLRLPKSAKTFTLSVPTWNWAKVGWNNKKLCTTLAKDHDVCDR